MRNILYIGLSVLSALVLGSCKNDLDILAPGEETISVYGVINPNEKIQNIRINKVYLTNGDAVTAGQDNATINYGPNELKVTLQRYVNGNLSAAVSGSPGITEIVLTETVVATAAGEFNAGQRIWQTDKKLFNTGQYKLTIKNVGSGKEFTSTTQMVDSVKSYGGMPFIYTTASNPPSHYPVHCGTGIGGYIWGTMPGAHTQQIAYVDYHVQTGTPKIKFKSVPNAKLYKVIMRFHYIDSLTDNVTAYRRYVDMNFPSQTSSTLAGGQEMEVSFSTPDFYSNLAAQIPSQTVGSIKHRTAHYIQYIIYACGEDMDTFLKVNQPSNSIAQDKPNYSNINGGVGVFAAVSKSSLGKELWSDFIDEIVDNPATNSLQFVKRYAIICP
ncbi:MAG: hypothetical protein V4580_12645 [Bacteroidota bacterium]